jgi:hypothetical protein
VRGWFGVPARDWREQSQEHFIVHVISELVIEHVRIALAGNPPLAPELYPHMAEPVCQHCGGHHRLRPPRPRPRRPAPPDSTSLTQLGRPKNLTSSRR